ncbi:MAG TPA: hypothetical protein VKH63_13440 [Candidatus Acidoferrum sp.]|jgi:hypothetical protein|nr:hypothetical protein [Candidatus Acidoferrum sp.]
MKTNISKQQAAPFEAIKFQPLVWLRLRSWVITGLVCLLGLAFPGVHSASAQKPTPAIRVRVDNYTQALPGALARAEREAARIFDAAGLRTVWLDCPKGHSPTVMKDPCQDPLEPTDIELRVVSESSQNKFQDTIFGFAVHPVLATIYYEYPVRLARSDNADFELPVILGCVIAHELGHLLLGSNSHSGSGIMQPRWERKQVRQAMTGTLTFTPGQARQIQVETQRRMRLNSANSYASN